MGALEGKIEKREDHYELISDAHEPGKIFIEEESVIIESDPDDELSMKAAIIAALGDCANLKEVLENPGTKPLNSSGEPILLNIESADGYTEAYGQKFKAVAKKHFNMDAYTVT